MFCKTIILSNSENATNNAPKGILTLSKENNSIKGKIRLYNINFLPTSTKVGLYINDKAHISNIVKKTNHYEFDLSANIDISQSVYCALIDTANNKQVILEGGSFSGFCFSDSPFDSILEARDEELEQDINKAIKDLDNCNPLNCSNCEYKKYFYQHCNQDKKQSVNENYQSQTFIDNSIEDISGEKPYLNTQIQPNSNSATSVSNTINQFQDKLISSMENSIVDGIKNLSYNKTNSSNKNIVDSMPNNPTTNSDTNQEKLDFLNDIIYQLDEMFNIYPADDILNSIIPNSRFVKVDIESPYVLGVIYEDKMLKYIAYGVPAKYNSLPPDDLSQHYQWLPLNPRDVMSDGYFMIFQDAITGTLVEINFEQYS